MHTGAMDISKIDAGMKLDRGELHRILSLPPIC